MLVFFVYWRTTAFAQSTDSLVIKEQILRQENARYIQMAGRDNVISDAQADSLQKITSGTIERPVQLSIDLLFQVRDYIDQGYEEQMRIVNEPVMEEHYYTARTMLPTKLSIPEDIVFPEEREAERQRVALEQLAESIARDFEREKLPAWQQWWIDHIPFFFGSRAWYKRKVTFINGHEVPVPAGDPRDR
mgnify:CR=1 FL=1